MADQDEWRERVRLVYQENRNALRDSTIKLRSGDFGDLVKELNRLHRLLRSVYLSLVDDEGRPDPPYIDGNCPFCGAALLGDRSERGQHSTVAGTDRVCPWPEIEALSEVEG